MKRLERKGPLQDSRPGRGSQTESFLGSLITWSPEYLGEIMAQLKILAADETVEKFKRIVLAKHGKLELSVEGEEALKLYIKKYERLLDRMVPPDEDPLKRLSAIGRSKSRHNALEELKLLEAGQL
jgi:hypothetical protein